MNERRQTMKSPRRLSLLRLWRFGLHFTYYVAFARIDINDRYTYVYGIIGGTAKGYQHRALTLPP